MPSFTLDQTDTGWALRDADGSPYFALGLNHIGGISSPGRFSDAFRDQYGGDWARFGDAAYAQMVQWGFNCCGYGAPDVVRRRLPFFGCLQVTGNSQWMPLAEFQYDDVFAPAFVARVDAEARKLVEEVGRSLNLIGYYWNDLPQWDIRTAREQKGTDWVSFMRGLPGGAPGRARYVRFLSEKYPTVGGLNAAYRTAVETHDAICGSEHASLWKCATAIDDDYEFLAVIARELYQLMSDALREHDGGHIILGEKYWLSDVPASVVREALPHIDVLAVQYGPEKSPLPGPGYERVFDRARMDALYREHQKPIIISDHNISFGTDEHQSTLWHAASSKAEGADLYREFLLGVVDAPYIVGYGKCQYISRHSPWRDALKQGMLAEDGSPYEPYASMVAAANRAAMVRFCTRT